MQDKIHDSKFLKSLSHKVGAIDLAGVIHHSWKYMFNKRPKSHGNFNQSFWSVTTTDFSEV